MSNSIPSILKYLRNKILNGFSVQEKTALNKINENLEASADDIILNIFQFNH